MMKAKLCKFMLTLCFRLNRLARMRKKVTHDELGSLYFTLHVALNVIA